MAAVPDQTMTVVEFLDWCDHQSEGRFELVDGHVVAMAPERIRHAQAKLRVTVALGDALSAAGLDCTAFVDGVGIQVDDARVRIPDASIQCGPVNEDDQLLDNPVVVVEVISPSSARSDAIAKVQDYFSVPSIRHYLIIDPVDRLIIRHSRDSATGPVITEIHRDGTIPLDPPGVTVATLDMLVPETENTPQEKGA